jgi:predicted polyphosphate/ATP-dependent NAD kinase
LVKTPVIEGLLVPTKDFGSGSEEEEKAGIAQYFIEEYLRPESLYLLGPGTTIKAITDVLGLKKTLLGVDALHNGEIVGTDLGEREILQLMEKFNDPHIVVTVIGAQGYIFGRGNQQFSSTVIRRVGKRRIHVLATEGKLRGLKYLLVDTGDPELDKELAGHIRVITGYREETVMSVVPACCPENYIKTPFSSLPFVPRG